MIEVDISIERYTSDRQKVWDDFVASSKNGTFLFFRNYMEYHSSRFNDHSLLIFRKGKLYCLLLACTKDDSVFSHSGLTYGGLIMGKSCGAGGILHAFEKICEYFRNLGFSKFVYKPTPHIYHTYPAEEDLYALFRMNGELSCRNISTSIFMPSRLSYRRDRRWNLNKAKREDIIVNVSQDYETFWHILFENLEQKYSSRPTHSLEEILHLSKLFPENIKLYVATKNKEMIAGVVCYIHKNVVHTQYISANKIGKSFGAVDLIITYLLDLYSSVTYFDFGTSNENTGKILNTSLIYQKEGFGGRGICYDTYTIEL